MTIRDEVARLMELYPKIFFACHRRHVRDPKTKEQLSAHQASVLDHLDDVEGTSMNTLAEHMGVTASTMSLTIDRLEARGYVRRERDAADGRRVLLRLTRKGLRIKDAQTVLDPDLVRNLLREIPAPQRQVAIDGLASLARAASQSMRRRRASRIVS